MTDPNQTDRRVPEFSVPWQPPQPPQQQWGQQQRYGQQQQQYGQQQYGQQQYSQQQYSQQQQYGRQQQWAQQQPYAQQPSAQQPFAQQAFGQAPWTGSAAPAIWEPSYGATFGEAIGRMFRKYRDFTGRASRREFWFALLFHSAVTMVLYIATSVLIAMPASVPVRLTALVLSGLLVVWVIGTLIPIFALYGRRLQDAGYHHNFALLLFVPVGSVVVLVMCCLESNPTGARFDRPRW
jgi:uncharacterized membrane protein YhaH (DUF805 family)